MILEKHSAHARQDTRRYGRSENAIAVQEIVVLYTNTNASNLVKFTQESCCALDRLFEPFERLWHDGARLAQRSVLGLGALKVAAAARARVAELNLAFEQLGHGAGHPGDDGLGHGPGGLRVIRTSSGLWGRAFEGQRVGDARAKCGSLWLMAAC